MAEHRHIYDERMELFFKKTEKILDIDSLLCVDPGLGGTGWAYWHKGVTRNGPPRPPTNIGAIVGKSGAHWMDKIRQILPQFEQIVQTYRPKFFCIEFQELWGSSAVSQAAVSGGDLFKLTILTGQFVRVCDSVAEVADSVLLVVPTLWKGQLSKKAIDIRIRRALGLRYPNHISDAVGIGLALQGIL